MRSLLPRALTALLLALGACSTPPAPTDSAPPDATETSVADAPADAPVDAAPEASATDASSDTEAAPGRAGEPCTRATECGGGGPWECYTGVVDGLCTHTCTDNASQALERQRCGGANTTCVTAGEGASASSYCERACDPTMAATGCRRGFVCTGWWYTHANGRADTAGCWTLCSVDADCPAGMPCNPRSGQCGGSPVDPSLRPDGEPCNPENTTGTPPHSTECRGACFRVGSGTSTTQGICGSVLNTAVVSQCPDGLARVTPVHPNNDNLGLCLLRSCDSNCDCTAPLRCIQAGTGSGGSCQYSDTDPGIACGAADGGSAEGGSVDASALDSTAGG